MMMMRRRDSPDGCVLHQTDVELVSLCHGGRVHFDGGAAFKQVPMRRRQCHENRADHIGSVSEKGDKFGSVLHEGGCLRWCSTHTPAIHTLATGS